jgi:F0F1-type ATP synthase assembly protein I
LDTQIGSCGFVLSDNRIQFFTEWKTGGFNTSEVYSNVDHFFHSTPLGLMQQNTIALSVFGFSHCRYAGSFQINTTTDTICQHGKYQNGLCVCSFRWTGPNCDKFSFPLVYTMAIAAGTFIIGALIAGLMAGCLFRKATQPSPQTIQGYEQYR